jgi:predicted ArsR family transcriptional regulator
MMELCEKAADAQHVKNPVPTLEAAEECIHQLLSDASHFFERKVSPPGYCISQLNCTSVLYARSAATICYSSHVLSCLYVLRLREDFDSLFSELRMSHIQSLCRARYGSLAARLFRCLLHSARLEETQLAELCTAPRKEVRRLLYQLHAAQLVSLQEVSRSSDRQPQKTFYLWGVPRQAVCLTYLESLAFSFCNLKLRAEAEAAKAKPVLDKVDTSKRISAEEKEQVEQWKKAADRMEMGMHQINQLIMLFQHF